MMDQSSANSDEFIIRLEGVSKVYPSVVANDNINLSVKKGEIHAVLGENGAGKSTMMKMIYGVTAPSSGTIYWKGYPVKVENPAMARQMGIGMVFQHFSLFETLSVLDNVSLGIPGKPDSNYLATRIEKISSRYGLEVDWRRIVHSLSVGERQRVEIIRCLLQNPQLLIMDEPTSVLAPQAVRKLFETLREIAAGGCSILYISHKLDEIQELCHVATVLRGGKVTGGCIPKDETPKSMARLMIGKDLPVCERNMALANGELRLRLAGLSHATEDPFGIDLQDIHLDVHAGEIVGIAGVSGNGQQQLLMALSGEELLTEQFPIQICAVEAGRLDPWQRRQIGMRFVPEDRLGRGALPTLSLADNVLLTTGGSFLQRGFIVFAKVKKYAADCIEHYSVKCAGTTALAKSLSGGNLQKFIIGREVMQNPKLLVVAQPTWGVDVGAAAFIRQSLLDLRNQGTAILVISEELDELFEISDRIAVIADGRLSPPKLTCDTNIEEIGVWMSGMWPGASSDTAARQISGGASRAH